LVVVVKVVVVAAVVVAGVVESIEREDSGKTEGGRAVE
jgi:hypothetical protein